MMQQAARYLFDLDFAAPPEPEIEEEIEEIPPEPMITVAEHERLLAEAIAKAHAAGETQAREDRTLLASEETLRLQKTILDDLAMIYTEVGVLLGRLEKDACNLAFAFASKFAERLVAQEPKVEVQALLGQILSPLRKTPHISIRLSDSIADEIRQAVDEQMATLGFEGKLTILADPAVMPGDCEVEWADGGIGRNLRSAIRQMEQLLDDHFAHIPDTEEEDLDMAPPQQDGSDGGESAPLVSKDEEIEPATAEEEDPDNLPQQQATLVDEADADGAPQ